MANRVSDLFWAELLTRPCMHIERYRYFRQERVVVQQVHFKEIVALNIQMDKARTYEENCDRRCDSLGGGVRRCARCYATLEKRRKRSRT